MEACASKSLYKLLPTHGATARAEQSFCPHPVQNAKIAQFTEILNKRNREYPRKELRAPKKGRQAYDFAPLKLIFQIVEVWGWVGGCNA